MSREGRFAKFLVSSEVLAWLDKKHPRWPGSAVLALAALMGMVISLSAQAESNACETYKASGDIEGQAKCLEREIQTSMAARWNALASEPDSQKREELRKSQIEVYKALQPITRDSREREEMRRFLAELEAPESARPIYLTGATIVSPEMARYVMQLYRRIEDCGTRHLPTRDGHTAYGSPVFAWELDDHGRLISIRRLLSSEDTLVDRHAKKVVRASAPFGRVPSIVRLGEESTNRRLIFFAKFNFMHDDKPVDLLPDDQACNWPAP